MREGYEMVSVSVIIPAYNCSDTIGHTVGSILASGMGNGEIIIIDDGSQDGTVALCDAIAEKYTCVRCIHQENAGVSSARNRGIKEAKGEYIWFFDADDSVESHAFCTVAEILTDYSPDMVVFGVEFDYYHHNSLFRRDELVPASLYTHSRK